MGQMGKQNSKQSDTWRTWGERFRDHCRLKGVSMPKLAERVVMSEDKVGVTEGALRHWLNGQREINLSLFFQLCGLAKADPQMILFPKDLIEEQLLTLYRGMADTDQEELVQYANRLYTKKHPERSPAAPFGPILPPVPERAAAKRRKRKRRGKAPGAA